MATSRRSLQVSTGQLTFSWAEPHASPSPSQDSASDWKTLVATWPWGLLSWLQDCIRVGSSGKMSPVSCLRTAEGTLVPSSGRWLSSGIASPTECWTLSTSECPNDAVASSLSDILQETGAVLGRFYLSPKACIGILRRAAGRGKKLPDALQQALETVALTSPTE